MNKLRLNSRRQIFNKFGNNLKIELNVPEGKVSKYYKKEFVEFKLKPTLTRTEKFYTKPVIPFESLY